METFYALRCGMTLNTIVIKRSRSCVMDTSAIRL